MRPLPLLLLGALLAPALLAAQRHTFVLGDADHSWASGGDGFTPHILSGHDSSPSVDTTNAPGNAVEYSHRPGWISPRFFDRADNVAALVLEPEGAVNAPNLLSVNSQLLAAQLTGMVNGDHRTALERRPSIFDPEAPTYGIWVTLDFGRQVPVHRLRFYPRNTVVSTPSHPYQDDYLRGYEIFLNDTLTSAVTGAPDQLVARSTANRDPIVDLSFSPRYVRLLKLRSLTHQPFEIDELEVYGAGYYGDAEYYSDVIDLGAPSLVSPVRLEAAGVGDRAASSLSLSVRSGRDATPVQYVRTRYDSLLDENVREEVTPAEYWDTPAFQRHALEDDEAAWSPWQPVDAGHLPPVPLPRQYIQWRLAFSGRLDAARLVDRLAFDYLAPPLADTLWAEVYPRIAAAGQRTTFTYALVYRGGAHTRGFDRLEIDTPTPAESLGSLRLDGVDLPYAVEAFTDTLVRLAFDPVERDEAVLQLDFDARVFRWGTRFSGRAFHSDFPDLPQALRPGQAAHLGPGDLDALSGLSVALTEADTQRLLRSLRVSPPAITPNGDGANDVLEVCFDLLHVLRPAAARFVVYDLAGRPVNRQHLDLPLGPATLTWDGRAHGRVVPPGLYLWVLEVDGDALDARHSGAIAVVY